tara:strand:+ start:3351 stop:4418 length:1068 start_codon:yes stop_codon:yes gene_type:complete
MNEKISYSLCWEDSDALHVLSEDNGRALLVASGGCLALSLLSNKDLNIETVEKNLSQNSLLRLKISAIQNLNYDDCMHFFGVFTRPIEVKNRLDIYEEISKDLSKEDKKFWEMNVNSIKRGIVHAGKWEKYVLAWNTYFLNVAVGRKNINNFILSENIEHQKTIFFKKIDNFFHRLIFRLFNNKKIQSRYGRHPDLLKFTNDSPGKIFYERLKRAWCEISIKKNYLFRYILESHYRKEMPLPDWAIKKNFNIIKNRLSKISLNEKDMISYLKKNKSLFDLIHLSNITDTMSSEESQLLFSLCAKNLNSNGKLVVWNNLVRRSPSNGFKLVEDITTVLDKNRLATYYGSIGVYELT